MAQQIERVGVLGAGLMGHGIAQVAAQSGYQVVVREVDDATLTKGIGKIEKQLARAVEREKLSQQDAIGCDIGHKLMLEQVFESSQGAAAEQVILRACLRPGRGRTGNRCR